MLWVRSPDWSAQTARDLHCALSRAFYDIADLKQIWIYIGMDPAKIAWVGSAEQVWPTLTIEAAAHNRLRNLIETVRDRCPVLAAEFDRVLSAELPRESWYACQSPFESHLIGPGHRQAVLNRYLLRSQIINIAQHDYPVLAIKGPDGSGRSFSRRILQHAAQHPTVHADLVVVDAAVDLPDPAYAVDLVHALAARLGVHVPLDQVERFTEDMRKALEAVALLVGACRHLPDTKRWIFLDSLDRPRVQPDLHAAVGHLARQVTNGQLRSTRLIVTGHPGDFPQDVLDDLQEEDISEIGVPEVRSFFRDVAGDIGRDIGDNDVDDLVRQVTDQVGVGGLSAVSKAASTVAHQYFAGAR